MTSHTSHWLTSYIIFDINGDFSQKSQNYPTPHVFCTPLMGFPLELGISTWSQKTRMMVLLGRERSLTISSATWIQYTNVTDRRTEGQTDTGQQQIPHLRIVSRSKNP